MSHITVSLLQRILVIIITTVSTKIVHVDCNLRINDVDMCLHVSRENPNRLDRSRYRIGWLADFKSFHMRGEGTVVRF